MPGKRQSKNYGTEVGVVDVVGALLVVVAALTSGVDVGVYKGDIDEEITIIENGLTYCTHINSQKTGWFYDHRANRLWIGTRAKNKRVLDLYAYQGGFGKRTYH